MFNKHEFLHDAELQKAIFNVFSSANTEIIIISPYIRLYDKLKDSLGLHLRKTEVHLNILFGKNFKWSKEDIEFISRFPNITVKHKENLHAKFYANERVGISTSMNLLESSFKNNYETGVLIEFDSEIASFMKRYILTRILYYMIAIPFFLILALIMPLITLNLSWFEKDKLTTESQIYLEKLFNEADTIIFEKKTPKSSFIKKIRKQVPESQIIIDRFVEYSIDMGYCIRSGEPIEFNPSQPYSKESYYEWVKEGSNRNHPENFCHRTRKNTNGKVSINNPILYS